MNLRTELLKAKKAVAKSRRPKTLSALTASCQDQAVAKSLSVLGPYPSRDKWRLVLIDGTERKSSVYETRAEAELIKARLEQAARDRIEKTIGQSLDDYRDYRVQYRGVKHQTADEHCRHLRDLLPINLPIVSLNPEKARRLYLDYAERPNKRNRNPISVNTHQWALLIAKC
jgi:hypothetical protein